MSTPSWTPLLLDDPLDVPLDVPLEVPLDVALDVSLEVPSFRLSFKPSLSSLNFSFKGGCDLPLRRG